MRKEGRPLPCCPLPSTWVSPRDLGARRLPPLLCSAWFGAVLLCSALVLYSVVESCPELSSAHIVFLLEQQESRAEFVESRTQLVRYNAWTALPHDRCWSQVCAKELTKYQTAAGPMQTLLDFSTTVGMDNGPSAQPEEERCIKWKLTMQVKARQCKARNAMQ